MAITKRKFPFNYLVLVLVIMAWCGIEELGVFDFIEERTIDWRFEYRGELPSKPKIFYLDVDAKSIADIGNLAWDRSYYTDVCTDVLRHGGAIAIGVDQVFSDRGMPEIADWERFRKGNMRMAAFLFSEPTPPVVLAAGYASARDRDINGLPIVRELPRARDPEPKNEPPELPQFRINNRIFTPPNVGLIDFIQGKPYRMPLLAQDSGRTWYNMAVELTRLGWKLPYDGLQTHDNRLDFVNTSGVLLASVPLLDGQDVEINWSTHWDSPQNGHASFSDALAASRMLGSGKNEEREAAKKFFEKMRDSFVLVGPVDPLLQDRAPTRLDASPVPRIGMIGELIRMFHSGQYLTRASFALAWFLIAALTACVCTLQVLGGGRRGVVFKICAALLIAGYVWAGFVIFARAHMILPLVTPLGAALTASFVLTAMQLFAAERMRHRITGFFGTYVSPALVERMIESGEEPQLGGAEVRITAFFSDIQNFTHMAESMPPARLVELMNDYLSSATDVITSHDGTLDKYVGDSVVAMFGAPVPCVDHAYRACVASQLVYARLLEVRERWPQMDAQPVRTFIGLNTGRAIVGNIGSNTRFNYTMMGDTVNVAARLQSAARLYGVRTLVSDETRRDAEKYGDKCVFRYLDKIVVKGRSHPVAVHEIMGLRDTLPPAALECSKLFSAAVEKFHARDWDGAAALFERSARLEWYPVMLPGHPTPSAVYLERCRQLKASPPAPDWDGIYVLGTK